MLKAAVLSALFSQCAPDVSPVTLSALMAVESSNSPYVVANVSDGTSHYFDSEKEAVEFTNRLAESGKKYSAGLMQIFVENFKAYGVTNETIFDHCKNIEVGADILRGCYVRALKTESNEQDALRKAFSCYYSGNFIRGFKAEKDGKSYVQRVESKVKPTVTAYKVPDLLVSGEEKEGSGRVKGNAAVLNTDNNDGSAWDVFGDY